MKSIALILLAFALSFEVLALEITTEHGSDRELEAVRILEALRIAHDLSRWEFTNRVNVESGVIPHSHPVLTLNSRHNDDADVFLSTYLHEQIHWHLDALGEEAIASAMPELEAMFPEVPVGGPVGARDEYSSYLHLVVCWLELDAVGLLLSEQRLQRVIAYWQQDHYTWIYEQVEDRWDEIGAVIEKHGLTIP